MDLQFDTFETLLVFLAILVVNFGASALLSSSPAARTRSTDVTLTGPFTVLQPSAMVAVSGWRASGS